MRISTMLIDMGNSILQWWGLGYPKLKTQHKNCESCPTQGTWKVTFTCQFSVLSVLPWHNFFFSNDTLLVSISSDILIQYRNQAMNHPRNIWSCLPKFNNNLRSPLSIHKSSHRLKQTFKIYLYPKALNLSTHIKGIQDFIHFNLAKWTDCNWH